MGPPQRPVPGALAVAGAAVLPEAAGVAGAAVLPEAAGVAGAAVLPEAVPDWAVEPPAAANAAFTADSVWPLTKLGGLVTSELAPGLATVAADAPMAVPAIPALAMSAIMPVMIVLRNFIFRPFLCSGAAPVPSAPGLAGYLFSPENGSIGVVRDPCASIREKQAGHPRGSS